MRKSYVMGLLFLKAVFSVEKEIDVKDVIPGDNPHNSSLLFTGRIFLSGYARQEASGVRPMWRIVSASKNDVVQSSRFSAILTTSLFESLRIFMF